VLICRSVKLSLLYLVHIIHSYTKMAATTPPILHAPTAKERKYDRQLRLWAASGQAALEDAHVLLVNSGPGVVGVEALKNLVLPGIGQFSILDAEIVEEEDLGVNFFLERDSLGKSRAEEAVRLLGELNPDVQGHAVVEVSVELPAEHS
jgi:amyloid beta precursor protein binding protein 1